MKLTERVLGHTAAWFPSTVVVVTLLSMLTVTPAACGGGDASVLSAAAQRDSIDWTTAEATLNIRLPISARTILRYVPSADETSKPWRTEPSS